LSGTTDVIQGFAATAPPRSCVPGGVHGDARLRQGVKRAARERGLGCRTRAVHAGGLAVVVVELEPGAGVDDEARELAGARGDVDVVSRATPEQRARS